MSFMLVDLLPVGWLTNRENPISAGSHPSMDSPASLPQSASVNNFSPPYCRPNFPRRQLARRRSRPSPRFSHASSSAALLVAVSAGKDQALHLYELNPKTGTLVQRAKYDLPGSPGSQCEPGWQHVVCPPCARPTAARFALITARKRLSLITEIGANAAYVATDRTGRTLLGPAGGWWAATLSVGAVIKTLSQSKRLGAHHPARCLNRFAFVPHTGRMRCINFGLMPRRASLLGTIRSRPTG